LVKDKSEELILAAGARHHWEELNPSSHGCELYISPLGDPLFEKEH